MKPTREDRQTQNEHINADKDFRKMDVETAKEATLPRKRNDRAFRVRKRSF